MISTGLVLTVLTLSVWQTSCQNTLMSYNLLGVSITFANRGTYTDFYVSTQFTGTGVQVADSWLGIGINTNAQMNRANVVVCQNSATTRSVSVYYNQGYAPGAVTYPNNAAIGLSNTGIQVVNSNLTCRFTRSNTNSDSNYVNVNPTTTLYVLVAFGSGI